MTRNCATRRRSSRTCPTRAGEVGRRRCGTAQGSTRMEQRVMPRDCVMQQQYTLERTGVC